MNENPAGPESRERLEIKVELATEKDWQAYKKLRLLTITDDPDAYNATPEELEQEIKKIEKIFPENWRKELSNRNKMVFIAWNGSEPVGIGLAEKQSAGVWHMSGSYIRPEFRAGIIGRTIFFNRLHEIRKRGGLKATLNVLGEKTELVEKYQRRGFKIVEQTLPSLVKNRMRPYFLMEMDLTDALK